MNLGNLTMKQVSELTFGKKHWSTKKNHIIRLAKNFGITVQTDEEIQYLIEVHCPNQIKRIKREFFKDSLTGKRKTKFTPTDIKGTFDKVEKPVIGKKYHISWAFSGAVFVLRYIEGDVCYLDNPKYKRAKQGKQLLKCKISELRHLH